MEACIPWCLFKGTVSQDPQLIRDLCVAVAKWNAIERTSRRCAIPSEGIYLGTGWALDQRVGGESARAWLPEAVFNLRLLNDKRWMVCSDEEDDTPRFPRTLSGALSMVRAATRRGEQLTIYEKTREVAGQGPHYYQWRPEES